MRCGEHGTHQSPFLSEIALDLQTFGLRYHTIDRNEFCNLTLGQIPVSIFRLLVTVELHPFGSVIVVGTPMLGRDLVCIKPSICPVLVIDRYLVKMPIVVVVGVRVVEGVNPTV